MFRTGYRGATSFLLQQSSKKTASASAAATAGATTAESAETEGPGFGESKLNWFLDRIAPAHLRGLHEPQERFAKEAQAAEAKKAQQAANKNKGVQLKTTQGERGFFTSATNSHHQRKVPTASGAGNLDPKNQSSKSKVNSDSSSSKDSKYEVRWSDELDGTTKPSSELGAKIGSNLPRSKWAEKVEKEASEEADILNSISSTSKAAVSKVSSMVMGGRSSADSSSKASTVGPKKQQKKAPGVFKRFVSTFSMSPDDASAYRDEDSAAAAHEELSDDKLQTGKYFKKLHAMSLKSWTKQCFTRLADVEDCKLISCEVENNVDADVVTVFVCAENLDEKKLEAVRKWVEAICPVTKSRLKILNQLEEDDRKNSAHVLASSPSAAAAAAKKSTAAGGRGAKINPLRQFAKRKKIVWVRIDPE